MHFFLRQIIFQSIYDMEAEKQFWLCEFIKPIIIIITKWVFTSVSQLNTCKAFHNWVTKLDNLGQEDSMSVWKIPLNRVWWVSNSELHRLLFENQCLDLLITQLPKSQHCLVGSYLLMKWPGIWKKKAALAGDGHSTKISLVALRFAF